MDNYYYIYYTLPIAMGYLSDNEIMDGIRSNDNDIIAKTMRWLKPIVVPMVKDRGGRAEDGEDILHEAMEKLIIQVRDHDYRLTGRFKNLFVKICINLWSNASQKKRTAERYRSQFADELYEPDFSEEYDRNLYRKAFQEAIEQLNTLCRELMKLFFNSIPLEIIAERLNKKYSYIRKQKIICLGELINLVRTHKLVREQKGTGNNM